jgi:hypothetical protein
MEIIDVVASYGFCYGLSLQIFPNWCPDDLFCELPGSLFVGFSMR